MGLRTSLKVWFWIYYILVDRFISLGYLRSWLESVGFGGLAPDRRFTSIIDIIWGLPTLPNIFQLRDVLIVSVFAWLFIVLPGPMARNYMYLFWFALIFWMVGGALFGLYTRVILYSIGQGWVEHDQQLALFGTMEGLRERWYFDPRLIIAVLLYLTYHITKFVRYLVPFLFLQTPA